MSRLDEAELAWAAGFFDGEGSTFARCLKGRAGYRQLNISVPQSGHDRLPLVLERFQVAVMNMGHIGRPNKADVYMWRTMGFEESQAVVALLWKYLSPVKRMQAAVAMRAVREQYETGRYAPRRGRRRPVVHEYQDLGPGCTHSPTELERAWAAGFLDAEGCFGLVRDRRRKDGTWWYRIRASASQNGEIGIPAHVHERLRAALGGMGRIEPHGEPDDFKWVAAGPDNVRRILELLAPWLGEVKVAQAHNALHRFARQERIHGDEFHCARGHTYDYRRMRGGHLRRICNACARLAGRARRAARGVPPRQFRDVSRRYNP